jgi:hypothetical protein
MDVFKTAVRDGDGGRGKMYVAEYLRPLAAQTVLSKPPYKLPHTCPAKFATDKFDGCLHPWVSDAVQ